MSADQRRRNGLFARIVADPWRKLFAIAIAFLFWFFVDTRINKQIERVLPLTTVSAQVQRGAAIDRLAVALSDRVSEGRFRNGDQTLKEVKVLIKGPRFKVAAIENEPLDLQITSFLRLDWSKINSVEFTAADLPRDHRLLQDVQVELDPPRIVLEVDHVDARDFPLTLDTIEVDEGALQGRLRRDTAEIAPATATVLGPTKELTEFVQRTTPRFRARVTAAGNDTRVQAPVDLAVAPGSPLRLATTHVLTMQVLPQTSKFPLELPILVDDLALPPEQRGLYQPETKTKLVRIAAAGELRSKLVNVGEGDAARTAEWAAANLRLLVTIPRPDAGGALPDELDRPARLLIADRRLAEIVDRNECLLDEGVMVKLRKK